MAKKVETHANKIADRQNPQTRGAGILLHITSLPSAFGIGDLGPEARIFVNFLADSGQKYWQVLPLNPPTDVSPYSAQSGFASNTLLISPEWLATAGFLMESQLAEYRISPASKIDIQKATKCKESLLTLAYQVFKQQQDPHWIRKWEAYKKQEAYWLQDYALFTIIKKTQKGTLWAKWPKKLKHRDKKAMISIMENHKAEIEEVMWRQFICDCQWQELRSYCQQKNVLLFGDVPIYVGYDSADVWANTDIFKLDQEGCMTGVAGVPPDYFSETGQLWGMPVFRWDVLKNTGYQWWVNRIRRNKALFDLVRLDHFRAFSSYWEVPADAKTAAEGTWQSGPGIDLFHQLKKQLGMLNFVAEDLGELEPEVYVLKNKLQMPGMKILQFAFGNDMPQSMHIPHNHTENFVVYTGTHDNNTTVGWYKQEAGKKEKQLVSRYVGEKTGLKNIHWALVRLGYASVARICIVPMQDLLGLDEKARFNVPGTVENNWLWRMLSGSTSELIAKKLRNFVIMYNR